jgi:phage gp45-like
MGLIELVKITDSDIRALRNAPGPTVVVKGVGLGGVTREASLYQQHGFRSRPVAGTRGVFVPFGSGSREGVIIATENYTLDITLDVGGAAIYSTNAAGDVQAEIKLRADGSIELNGDSKRLVTYGELNTAIQTFITALNLHVHSGGTLPLGLTGAPTVPASLNISASQTSTLKTGG